jgi:hypothetical protein
MLFTSFMDEEGQKEERVSEGTNGVRTSIEPSTGGDPTFVPGHKVAKPVEEEPPEPGISEGDTD